MKKIIVLIGLFFLFYNPALFSQQQLFGIVTNEREELLIGATVQWKGTTTGAITDTEGRFWLPRQQKSETLQVRYVGYNPVEVLVLPGEDSIWIEISGFVALQTATVTATGFDNATST
ncbi:MAG: carboxypeptidase-like regulatory domain-containing protein, partial [Saprospiraceae bacterium]|nr:carboxypeptidase-like regulatory domain-containing protein [Saprospiraceae bacterium]